MKNNISKLLRILFVERRIPGVVLIRWYGFLEKLGIRYVTLKTANGLSVRCMTNARVVFIEVFEKEEYAFPGFDFENCTVVDIGANQGFFTLYAASRGARVFSFEPLTENVELLKENVRRNGLEDRVTVFHAAVTGLEREIKLFVGLNQAGNTRSETASIVDDNRGGVAVEERIVEGVPAASLIEHCGLTKCDFLKMDCEGAEFVILENMASNVLTAFDRVAIEYHDGRYQEIVNRLVSEGYDILQADTDEVGLIKGVSKTVKPTP